MNAASRDPRVGAHVVSALESISYALECIASVLPRTDSYMDDQSRADLSLCIQNLDEAIEAMKGVDTTPSTP